MTQKNIKILLVEDDPVFARLVRDVLEDNAALVIDYSVECAANSAAAVQRIPNANLDLILLDLGLPDSKDEETFEKIYEVASHIPIVLLTSNEDELLALELIKKGAQDYLIKSATDLRMLSRVIRYAIERKRIVQELKDAHEKLKSAQAQLVQSEKMESIGKLAVGIAHEVKNPIAIVQQCVDFLSHTDITKEPNALSVLNDMTESIDRADRIIEELLHLASPPDSSMSFESLNSILDGVLSLLKHELMKKGVKVVKQYNTSLNPILVNRNGIEQVFLNLILNAVQAMDHGGQLELRTALQKVDEITSFQVAAIKDQGKGISAESLDKIFEPYFTTKKKEGGTGLGLSVAKNIMEAHRGAVELTNNKDGKGATATVMFRVPTF